MRYDTADTPLPQLLRGDCLGCHAQGGAVSLYSIGVDKIPQVYHQGSQPDLAGGNFGYIDGRAPSPTGASDSKGHNLPELMAMDSVLLIPPGGIVQGGHDDGGNVNRTNLTCAGTNGCHGVRDPYNAYPTIPKGITGAHHDNINGVVDPAGNNPNPGHGYRFLVGVKGYEDTDWEYTDSDGDHNEYWGLTAPVALNCAPTQSCHGFGGVRPPNGTISEFCGTCHGNFHTITTGLSSGIGPGTSPFIRHPSDYSIAAIAGTEYASYTTYDVYSPVARTSNLAALDGTDNTVDLSQDAVMCLSCHVAHGSMYSDMLRWSYETMIVNGGPTNPAGCFACHTEKD